jgi:predicted CXXCH cytochrome family protein
MNKIYSIVYLSAFIILCSVGIAVAIDSPHDPVNLVECNGCHTLHNATGRSLTKDTNANLCISCHTSSGGLAAAKPFSTSDQANDTPGEGTSHRWDGTMPATDDANNAYGLRSVDSISNAALKARLERFGTCSTSGTTKSVCESNAGTWTADVVCSTCHNVHSQVSAPWNPFGGPGDAGTATGGTNATLDDSTKSGSWTTNQWAGFIVRMTSGANTGYGSYIASNTTTQLILSNALPAVIQSGDGYEILGKGGDVGIASSAGTNITIDDSTKATSWTADQWVGYYVKMTSGLNAGEVRQISTNTTIQIEVSSAFTNATALNDGYEIIGGHFLRMSNNLNQLCEDCHYYRQAGVYTDLTTWDGTKKSHPVVMDLQTDVTNPLLFIGTAPVEANCTDGTCPAQTGAPRYHLNGTGDTNPTNNIILDVNGKIRCLTCHGMHWTDSDSSTVDQP